MLMKPWMILFHHNIMENMKTNRTSVISHGKSGNKATKTVTYYTEKQLMSLDNEQLLVERC